MTATLVHNGTTFRLPFAELFRPLNAAEEAELETSLRALGQSYDVLTYDSPAHGADCVIDGANRLRKCSELGLVPRVRKLNLADETARRMALDNNIARRQVTIEEARAARVKRVVVARTDGKSLRAIAAQEQVSESQVRFDLDRAVAEVRETLETAPSGSGAHPPAHLNVPPAVTGMDGKTYPAQKPRKKRTRKKSPAAKDGPVNHLLDLRTRAIALTQDINRALGAGDGAATRLKDLMVAARVVLWSNESARFEFQPLLGVPYLLATAAEDGKLPNEKTVKLKYTEAAGAWVSPAVVAIKESKAKKRSGG